MFFTTPSAPIKGLPSAISIEVASTPPLEEGTGSNTKCTITNFN